MANDEHFLAGGSRDFEAPWGAPIVLRAGRSLVQRVEMDGQPLLVSTFGAGIDPQLVITKLRLEVHGRDFDPQIQDMRPWSTVEEIAAFVAGDGSDSQRLALADAIRVGWAKGARIKVGDE